ncbi:hypothetical protein E7811_16560 [Aliigemmobacter aestuarii]|uniref:NIDO domain-containing protein n=1 Tax=Aliigemmobacter aestuarii TaxID=1445661 RepID=A0A4S3MJB4_9RHOB|nr:Hint domain-containing protein [Gemmobacter aestuarii]THD81519.1 hypothetical protein E7811_16560 [Gemmobacter aestuarii]
MATINTGLGGPQGVGEGSFRAGPLTAGNYDDGSILVNITSVFGPAGINYFGTYYTSIYINTNGLISFGAPRTAYTPQSIATINYPAIAVFWSDIDLRSGTATGTNNIYWDLDPVSGRVTVTWLGVKPYTNHNTSGTNTFQVVLEHTQNGNFEVDFIYQQVDWANGGFGVAQAGLTDGGSNDYILPGSGNATSILNYENSVLDPNDPNGVWSTRFLNGNPVCFVTGTRIATPEGWRQVETLQAGDRILTRDDGAQPIRWVGGGQVMASEAALPVLIEAGALGNRHDLRVSGQHLMLLDGIDCELLFGEGEVLAAAKDLVGLPGITAETRPRMVGYYHLLLDHHHIIEAEGAGAETLHPGPQALQSLPRRAMADLMSAFLPYEIERFATRPAARRVLKAHEARVLVAHRTGGIGHGFGRFAPVSMLAA